MTNKAHGTLYTGITNDITRRVEEHKTRQIVGFTSKYFLHILVYVETHDFPDIAIAREKQLKKWRRQWKIELIEYSNPEWKDLSYTLLL